jgi:hypothetical protein
VDVAWTMAELGLHAEMSQLFSNSAAYLCVRVWGGWVCGWVGVCVGGGGGVRVRMRVRVRVRAVHVNCILVTMYAHYTPISTVYHHAANARTEGRLGQRSHMCHAPPSPGKMLAPHVDVGGVSPVRLYLESRLFVYTKVSGNIAYSDTCMSSGRRTGAMHEMKRTGRSQHVSHSQ